MIIVYFSLNVALLIDTIVLVSRHGKGDQNYARGGGYGAHAGGNFGNNGYGGPYRNVKVA